METKVELKQCSDLRIVTDAIRTCTDTEHKMQMPEDINLIDNCIRKGHDSVLEHCFYTFKLEGFSRAMLQELARHRIASFSVMSTRWCLKRLKKERPFLAFEQDALDRGSEYLVMTGARRIDLASVRALDMLRENLKSGFLPDKAKYSLPDALKTKAMMTINLRSWRNMVKLRTSEMALWEFRQMMHRMIHELPAEHRRFISDVANMKRIKE